MQFADILKSPSEEGKEKHVPTIEVDKGTNTVSVIVGKEVPHPNTIEHYIVWAELYGVKQEGQVISLGRVTFAPSYTSPNAVFTVPVDQFKSLCALEYCNIHGLWQNCVEV
jgi:superoxide reductase